jgi:hypothetical protein
MSQNDQCILQDRTFHRRLFYSCTWVGMCDSERKWKWSAICRWDESITIGPHFLCNTELVDCRYWNMLGLITHWMDCCHLKFSLSNGLVYISLKRKTSLYVCICVYTFHTFWKNLCTFMKLSKTLCHLRPRQLILLNFPGAAIWTWVTTSLYTIHKLFILMGL